MVRLILAIVAALGFFRVLDGAGTSSAVLYALGVLLIAGVVDLGGLVGRKLRGGVPPKGGRA